MFPPLKRFIIGLAIRGPQAKAAIFEDRKAGRRLLKTLSAQTGKAPELRAVIEDFLRQGLLSDRLKLVCCAPRRIVMVRFLELPSVRLDEVKSMAAIEARKLLPSAQEEPISDAVILRKDPTKGVSEALLVTAHRGQMESLLRFFNQLGRLPDAFALSCLALQSFLKIWKKRDFGNYVHAHAQDGWLELNVFRRGELALSRAVPVRKDEDWNSRVLSERRQASNGKEGNGAALERIILSGDWEDIRKEQGKIEARWHSPVESVGGADGEPDPVLIGSCLLRPERGLDLLPIEQKRIQMQLLRRRRMRSAGSWFLAWVLATLGTAGWTTWTKCSQIARLDADIRKLEPEARQASGLLQRAAFLDERMGREGSPLEALGELHRIAPGGIALSSLSYEADGRMALQGSAERFSQVLELVRRLEDSPVFSKAELRGSGSRKLPGRTVVDFQAQCRLGEAR